MVAITSNTPAGCIGPDHAPDVVRLPVAPRVNHRIRFAPLNQAKEVSILPIEAVQRVAALREAGAAAEAVLLYGPGDPLAGIEPVLETMQLLRNGFDGLKIIIRTLGIDGLKHADKLSKSGVDEVELLIDGVDPVVLEQIYAWVRPGFKTLKLAESIDILRTEQANSIQAFKDAGMHVRLITTLYPTVNEEHLAILAKKSVEYGADEIVLYPYTLEEGADITLPPVEPEQMEECIARLEKIIPARSGRPLAIGPLASPTGGTNLPKPDKERPNVAVVSTNGMDIDLHLGQAPQILVYGPREDGLACLLECRKAPEPGSGSERWDRLAGMIPDCFALLAASAGEKPKQILGKHNIRVIVTQENIEGTVDVLYGGGKKGKKGKTNPQPTV